MVKEYKCILGYPECKKDTIVQYHPNSYPEYWDIKSGKRYTHLIVENYPEFWEEVVDWDALLEEAKRKYPIGTRVKSLYLDRVCTIKNYDHRGTDKYKTMWAVGESINPKLWENNKWAEIIEPLFLTEDGVNVYDDSNIWWVRTDYNDDCDSEDTPYSYGLYDKDWNSRTTTKHYKWFSTKQAAEAWVEENKPIEKVIKESDKKYTLDEVYDKFKDFLNGSK